ncbi:helix-turn-helix transcriptional regulator [Lactobacillus mulieris]|jgi:transcriptional activator, rgg/gadR/mutR family, C-terminal domain|uniref:Helix-turn-helix transcriptional regulator n=1 Tax=Lactobacillus mulieris TaxID=2508708 RepID=A0AAP3GX03_9LACO|nr:MULTISPECIES: helix-turn-helix transcriptional regulator [Lactobacillus]EEU20476.1 transcriptional activator, Rgg/GadR/MutR family domain-containing protein [Lactobacillus jensenii 27-2-CHN]EEX23455.1 DNA-binding helix-turn-helix protein [Lactobacillus jensenii 115-3-CHN]EFH30470.1 DNA-binding helix-turn-helix protein [Lactobacillus jensenii JV-V16]KAA9244739.1 helix-turn-helix transcriptional regulator [Lactobacillus jensenii]KAA9367366.1 helix-turn-helix transcriptional regulator [Lactoba
MEIGAALKVTRKKLNLSQSEMAGNILTKSYYSKIERGIHEINAQDLIDILNLHGIRIQDFFEEFNFEKNTFGKSNFDHLHRLVGNAYYQKDTDGLLKVIDAIDKFPNSQNNRLARGLRVEAKLLYQGLKYGPEKIDEETIREVKQLMFNSDNWDELSLTLLSVSLSFFKNDELSAIIKAIVTRNKPDKLTSRNREIVSSILINYLAYSYNRKITKGAALSLTFSWLSELDSSPKNCLTKIYANYFQMLLSGNKEKANQIRQFLNDNGMEDLTRYLAR